MEALCIHSAGYRFRIYDRVSGFVVLIKSPSGKVYRVDHGRQTCSCPSGVFRRDCKHLSAVNSFFEILDWGDSGLKSILGVCNKHKKPDAMESHPVTDPVRAGDDLGTVKE